MSLGVGLFPRDYFPRVGSGNRKAVSAGPGTTVNLLSLMECSQSSEEGSTSASVLRLLLVVGPLLHDEEPCLFNPHILQAQPLARHHCRASVSADWMGTGTNQDLPKALLTGLKSCMGFCQAWIGSQSTLPYFPKENIGLGSEAGHSPQALLGYN